MSDRDTLREVEPGQLWSCGSWIALTLQHVERVRTGPEVSDLWSCLVLLGPDDGFKEIGVGEVDSFPIAHPHSSWYKL